MAQVICVPVLLQVHNIQNVLSQGVGRNASTFDVHLEFKERTAAVLHFSTLPINVVSDDLNAALLPYITIMKYLLQLL